MTFTDLPLIEPLLHAVRDAGYTTPTPIQARAIPAVLAGRDLLGCAQTGTGKTASFTLPMLDIMQSGRARARMPRALILEPTRELAAQVADNFVKYAKYLRFDYALIIGGESMADQIARLNRGVDVLIATPGRLIDLFERGGLLLTDVRVLVIDEADRMLDMGFIPDVERIVSLLPRMRQTLFFSATMPPEIKRLADAFLHNPRQITVAPPASVAPTVAASLLETVHLTVPSRDESMTSFFTLRNEHGLAGTVALEVPGGVNLLLGDGSVRFVKDSVAPAAWQGLATRAGGEVLSSDAW